MQGARNRHVEHLEGRILLAAGDLDPSFEHGTSLRGANHAVAVLNSGKILMAGEEFQTFASDFGLVRHNSDGTLDTSFGNGGILTTDFRPLVSPTDADLDAAFALAVFSDDSFIAAGRGGSSGFALARYQSNGNLDGGFGIGGKVFTEIGGSAAAASLLLLPDGKVLAGGSVHDSSADFALVRYNADGSLDQAFGSNGIVKTDFGGSADGIKALALDGDKVVAVGVSGTSFALARYESTGALDATFGIAGKVVTSFTETAEAGAVAVLGAGKTLVVGRAGREVAFARYNSDGSLDSTFGGGIGTRTTTFLNGGPSGYLIQPSGRILVTGSGPAFFGAWDALLARYNPDGSLDTTFGGGDGSTTMSWGHDREAGNAIALQPDGRIVIGGGAGFSFCIARFLGDELVADDPDDQINEIVIGGDRYVEELVSALASRTFSDSISNPTDVDLFGFEVTQAGQRVAFDISTPVDSALMPHLRVFDHAGTSVLASEGGVGFLEYHFDEAGQYYVGVSQLQNKSYDAFTGEGDIAGLQSTAGAYTVRLMSSIIGFAEHPRDGRKSLVRIERFADGDFSAALENNITTWIVVHGRESSSQNENLKRIAEQIDEFQAVADQVLMIDWEGAADATGSTDFTGEDWIWHVASWAAEKLTAYGIEGKRLNLVGHSWGSYISDEIAERIAFDGAAERGVNSIVALDAPVDVAWPVDRSHRLFGFRVRLSGGVYNPEGNDPLDPSKREVDFGAHSRFCWAFRSSELGSVASARTADESFDTTVGDPGLVVAQADVPAHTGNITDLFGTIIKQNNSSSARVANRFSLTRLLNHVPGPWLPRNGFEGSLQGVKPAGALNWEPLSLQYGATVESVVDDAAGDTGRSATPLGSLQASLSATGWVGSANPDDFYSFTLTRRTPVIISLTGLRANAELQLIRGSPSGLRRLNSRNPDAQSESIAVTLPADTYFVHIYPRRQFDNTYYKLEINVSAPAAQTATALSDTPSVLANASAARSVFSEMLVTDAGVDDLLTDRSPEAPTAKLRIA